jgi:hypothetical protein
MKTPIGLIVALGLVLTVRAQPSSDGSSGSPYSPAQLDQLLAPIALYPDPLVALILPGSTAPADITLAARYLAANGDPAGIDAQSWDPSVKGLAHYPDLIKWLDDNLQWTQTLGAAFTQQPADVLQSVQRLRARAVRTGALVSTAQQQVVMDGDTIRIVPTQPNTIYLPQYDSEAVYDSSDGYSGPLVAFGIGYPVGAWLGYECDWDDFGIWIGPWHPGWGYHRDWRDSGRGGAPWRPDPRRVQEVTRNFSRPQATVPRPRLSVGGGPERQPSPRPRLANPVSPTRPEDRGRDVQSNANPAMHAPSGLLPGANGRGVETRAPGRQAPTSHSAPVKTASPTRPAASSPNSNDNDNRDHH